MFISDSRVICQILLLWLGQEQDILVRELEEREMMPLVLVKMQQLTTAELASKH